MKPRGYTPPVLPEEEAIIYGDDGATPLTILQTYLFGLIRRSMNRKTGISGDKSRISWGGLYERAYEDARAGYSGTGDAWGSTRDKRILFIRNQVRRIEKLGLVDLVSKKGGTLQVEFVIFNKYRSVYFSNQNKVTSNLPLEDTSSLPPEYDSYNNNLECGYEPEVTTQDSPEVTTYPEVSRSSINQSSDDHFEIGLEWTPSDFFVPLAKRSMIAVDGEHEQLYAETVTEFVMFWSSPEAKAKYASKASRSQRDWERALLQTLQRNKNRPAPKANSGKVAVTDEYRVPKDDSQLVAWAEKHGYCKPGSRTYYEYRGALYQAVRDRRDGKPAQVTPVVSTTPDKQAQQGAEKQRDELAMQRLAALGGVSVDQLRKKG